MNEYRMAKRMLMAEASVPRVRGTPRLGLNDGVNVDLGSRGMTVYARRQCLKDMKEWSGLNYSDYVDLG